MDCIVGAITGMHIFQKDTSKYDNEESRELKICMDVYS